MDTIFFHKDPHRYRPVPTMQQHSMIGIDTEWHQNEATVLYRHRYK